MNFAQTHTHFTPPVCDISTCSTFYCILSKLKLISSTLKKLPVVTHLPLFAWTSHPGPHVNDQEMVFLTILCHSNFGSGSQKRHTASGFQAWEISGKSVLRRSGGLSGCLRWLCHKTQKLRGAACRVWSAERVEEAKDVGREGGHRKRTLRHFKRRPRPGVHCHWVWKPTLSVRLLTNIFFFTLWSFFFFTAICFLICHYSPTNLQNSQTCVRWQVLREGFAFLYSLLRQWAKDLTFFLRCKYLDVNFLTVILGVRDTISVWILLMN